MMPTERDNFFARKLLWDLKDNKSSIGVPRYLAVLMMFAVLLQRVRDKDGINYE